MKLKCKHVPDTADVEQYGILQLTTAAFSFAQGFGNSNTRMQDCVDLGYSGSLWEESMIYRLSTKLLKLVHLNVRNIKDTKKAWPVPQFWF